MIQVKLHFEYKSNPDFEDSLVIEAETEEEIKEIAAKELDHRGKENLSNYWSETL